MNSLLAVHRAARTATMARPARTRRAMAIAVCAMTFACSSAYGQAEAPRGGLEVEALPLVLQGTQAAALYRDAVIQAAYRQPEDGLRARWWSRSAVIQVGAGADTGWTAASGAALGTTVTPVVGVRALLSPRTHLVYELTAPRPWADTAGVAAEARQSARWALEFKAAGAKGTPVPAGLFRIQMDGNSTLLLRPRGGGMSVAYRSKF